MNQFLFKNALNTVLILQLSLQKGQGSGNSLYYDLSALDGKIYEASAICQFQLKVNK